MKGQKLLNLNRKTYMCLLLVAVCSFVGMEARAYRQE